MLIVDNVKFNLHVHAWFDMSRVVLGQFVILVLLALCQVDEIAPKSVINKLRFFLHCSIFSMPRIPNNLRERAICMLDAGISTEHVARHVGCSSRAIRNLRIRLRTTGSTKDLPRRGRPHVTTRGQNRYMMGFIITESVRKLFVIV